VKICSNFIDYKIFTKRNVPYFPGSHPVITDNTSHNTNCGKFRKHRKKMNKELPLCCVTNGTESTLAFIAKHVLKWNDIGIEKVSDGTLGGKLAHHYEDRGLQFLRQLGRDWERLPTKSEIGLRNALASLAKADFLVGELTKIIQQEEDIEPCRLLLEYPMWVIMWLQSAAKVIQYMYKLDSHLYEGKEITKILRSVAENWKKAVREYKEFEGELRQATTLLPDEIQQGVSISKSPAPIYLMPISTPSPLVMRGICSQITTSRMKAMTGIAICSSEFDNTVRVMMVRCSYFVPAGIAGIGMAKKK
jgi:hypothetical protein